MTQQYREAVEESKRIDNIQKTLALGHIVADEDRQSCVQEHWLTQLKNLHLQYFVHF